MLFLILHGRVPSYFPWWRWDLPPSAPPKSSLAPRSFETSPATALTRREGLDLAAPHATCETPLIVCHREAMWKQGEGSLVPNSVNSHFSTDHSGIRTWVTAVKFFFPFWRLGCNLFNKENQRKKQKRQDSSRRIRASWKGTRKAEMLLSNYMSTRRTANASSRKGSKEVTGE